MPQDFQEQKVRFAVIDGSREWTEPASRVPTPKIAPIDVEEVEAEANRRLRTCRLNEWRTREFVTGSPIPDSIRHFAMQVEFAAKAISRLSPIPQDFDSDIYWPRMLDA